MTRGIPVRERHRRCVSVHSRAGKACRSLRCYLLPPRCNGPYLDTPDPQNFFFNLVASQLMVACNQFLIRINFMVVSPLCFLISTNKHSNFQSKTMVYLLCLSYMFRSIFEFVKKLLK